MAFMWSKILYSMNKLLREILVKAQRRMEEL